VTPLGKLLAQVACVALADAEHLDEYGVVARSSATEVLVRRWENGRPLEGGTLRECRRLRALAQRLMYRAREEGVDRTGTDDLFG
jgi:hypothetical protein